jgi:DNA-binding CsgD family transcriptional regulator
MKVPPEPSLICEEDARVMVRLLGEVLMMPGDLTAQKRALMKGLAKLVNADAWMWVLSSVTGDEPTAMQLLYDGYSQEEMAVFTDVALSPDYENPSGVHALKMLEDGEHKTETRHQCFDDAEWAQFPAVQDHFDKLAGVGVDQYIMSLYPLDQTHIISGIGMHRFKGRPDFTERERRIVHIIAEEVRWLHYTGLPEAGDDGIPSLSPRLKSVLTLLLDGQAPNQIASGLKLSPHTVKDYIKTLYKHFGVTSRAELMRRFMAGGTPE